MWNGYFFFKKMRIYLEIYENVFYICGVLIN